MMYHFDPMTRTVRATMIWDGVHPMDLAVSIMILTLQSSIKIWIRIFWSGRDKLDSLFVTCISSFMFAFDSFLTWPMVPLKQKPENGNYFTLAMWRSWKPLDLIQTHGYRVQLYMILCRAKFALSECQENHSDFITKTRFQLKQLQLVLMQLLCGNTNIVAQTKNLNKSLKKELWSILFFLYLNDVNQTVLKCCCAKTQLRFKIDKN